MHRLYVAAILLWACGTPHGTPDKTKGGPTRLVLKALGPVAQQTYPGGSVTLKVVAFEAAESGIESEGDLRRASGIPITWTTSANSNRIDLSHSSVTTNVNGISEIEVDAGDSSGFAQVDALANGTEPVTFTVQVLTDIRQLDMLSSPSLAATVNTTETMRLRLVRPSQNGGAATPVAHAIINVALVGGAFNGAGFETEARDQASLVSDSAGLLSLRFKTGSSANVTYQVEFCGAGSCEGIAKRTVNIAVYENVASGGECTWHSECGSGFVCAEGECQPAAAYCGSHRDCQQGYRCGPDKLCVLNQGAQCTDNDDCEQGEQCGSAHQCIDAGGCLSDSACPSGASCDEASGACVPDGSTPSLDVRGRWFTHYHFDISDTLPGLVSGMAPVVDFLNLIFASQLEIPIPILGNILEDLLDQLIAEYVPAWVPRVARVMGDFIHLFENVDAQGEMLLGQSPTAPFLGGHVTGQESWEMAQLYVASLCAGGPAQFAQDRSCGKIDVVLEPTFNLSYSNNSPTVGVKVDPFNGVVLGQVLKLHNRSVALELRQLVNIALDLVVGVASGGDYFDFEEFLVDAVPCEDIQDVFDDLACDISNGSVCSVNGIEQACEAASTLAVGALTNVLGSIPVGLYLDFEARAVIHDTPVNGVADVLGSPTNPDNNSESALTGEDTALFVFGGELDDDSWWYGEK